MSNLDIYFDKIYRQLCENKSSNIYFWGASSFLEEFLLKYNLDEFENIKGIIDNDVRKSGTNLGKYQVISPENIDTKSCYKIIFAIKNKSESIYKQLEQKLYETNLKLELLPNVFEQKNSDLLIDKIYSNKIYLINSKGEKKEVSYVPNLRVEWWGKNSTVEIEEVPNFRNAQIFCSDNCHVKIGRTPHLVENFKAVLNEANEKLTIGRNFSCVACNINFGMESDLEVNIGNDCMFSKNIDIRPADSHIIYDLENKKIINKPSKINIGNHVWVGFSVLILKDSNIPDNSIIGAGSVVTKKFTDNNIAIAGNPAKIIKRNINWSREHICKLENEEVIDGKV